MTPGFWPPAGVRTRSHAVSIILLASVCALSIPSPIVHEPAPVRNLVREPTPAQSPDRDSASTMTASDSTNAMAASIAPPAPQRDVEEEHVDKLAAVAIDKHIEPPSHVNLVAEELEVPTLPPEPEEHGSDEIGQYLWQVYQRSGAKQDSSGDFSWKDVSAAARLGISAQDYVINGMDPDFRELLFAMGHAMDADGIDWTILSAFRDDYRQSLAVGYKAHAGNSFHGGSAATGGYGHGCAVDLASTDGQSNALVWNWLDQHGEQFGLYRPLREVDPAHIQPRGGWHQLAAARRGDRLGSHPESDLAEAIFSASVGPSAQIGLSDEQYNCVRPAPVPGQTASLAHRLKAAAKVATYLLASTSDGRHLKDKDKEKEKDKEKDKDKEAASHGTGIHHTKVKHSTSEDDDPPVKGKPKVNVADKGSAGKPKVTIADKGSAGKPKVTIADKGSAGKPKVNVADKGSAVKPKVTIADRGSAGKAKVNVAAGKPKVTSPPRGPRQRPA
jgi:hypothetical protein